MFARKQTIKRIRPVCLISGGQNNNSKALKRFRKWIFELKSECVI